MLWACSVVQNYIEQRAVDLQATIVLNETHFSESVHEKTNSRTSRAYHLGQCLLTYFGDHGFGNAREFKMMVQRRHQEKSLVRRFEIVALDDR